MKKTVSAFWVNSWTIKIIKGNLLCSISSRNCDMIIDIGKIESGEKKQLDLILTPYNNTNLTIQINTFNLGIFYKSKKIFCSFNESDISYSPEYICKGA